MYMYMKMDVFSTVKILFLTPLLPKHVCPYCFIYKHVLDGLRYNILMYNIPP